MKDFIDMLGEGFEELANYGESWKALTAQERQVALAKMAAVLIGACAGLGSVAILGNVIARVSCDPWALKQPWVTHAQEWQADCTARYDVRSR